VEVTLICTFEMQTKKWMNKIFLWIKIYFTYIVIRDGWIFRLKIITIYPEWIWDCISQSAKQIQCNKKSSNMLKEIHYVLLAFLSGSVSVDMYQYLDWTWNSIYLHWVLTSFVLWILVDVHICFRPMSLAHYICL
jgi:hypothetical protein